MAARTAWKIKQNYTFMMSYKYAHLIAIDHIINESFEIFEEILPWAAPQTDIQA